MTPRNLLITVLTYGTFASALVFAWAAWMGLL